MKQLTVIFLALLFTNCASSTNQKKMTDYRELIRKGKDVFIENTTFTEAIDFTKILPANPVNKGVSQVRIVSSITFSNCTFKEDLIAFSRDDEGNQLNTSFQSNLSFVGCTFDAPVNFRGISVSGKVVFSGSFFENTAVFEESSFQQLAFFNNCSFHKELRFQNAFFMQRANFLNAQFDETASFQGSTFNSTAQFSNTRFYGYADFSLVRWKEDVFFNYAELAERATFSSSTFWGFADFLTVSFGFTEMINCTFFGELTMTGSSIKKELVFRDNFFVRDKPDLNFFERGKIKLE
jgi:hypothetical protein